MKNKIITALMTAPLSLAANAAGPELQPSPDVDAALPVVTIVGESARHDTTDLALGVRRKPIDTPFSISEVPAERLWEQAALTLQDALRNVPGAQADSGFNGSHTQFFILRGAIADSGTGSNRIMRDGVRLSNYPFVAAFVDSVDVLRGPGAALAVRSEPGGSVNLRTRRPELRNFGALQAGIGENDEQQLSVDLNRMLSEEHGIAARVIAVRSRASQWRGVPDELDGVKLGLSKTERKRYSVGIGFEATNQTYRPDYGIPSLGERPVPIPRNRQLGEPFADSTSNNRIVDLHGQFTVDDRTSFALALTHLENDSVSIKNGLTGNPLRDAPPGTWKRFTSIEPDTRRRIDSALASVSRTQAIGQATHQLYAAAEFYKETLDQPGQSASDYTPPQNVFNPVYGVVKPPPPGVNLRVSQTRQNLHAAALSLQDTIDYGPWTVVGGVRYDHQEFVYGDLMVLPANESRWSPKVALLRRLAATDTVYASFATGTAPNQGASSSNQSLPSRRSRQVELGWKSAWAGGALRSDLALFQLEQLNMISDDQSTEATGDRTVDGSGRSRGLELSLTGTLGRTEVSAQYAYTTAEFRENALFSGKRLPNVARHAGSLWAQYDWGAAGKTSLGAYAQSRRYAERENQVTLPGYVRLDLVHTWALRLGGDRALEAQFAVRNLADREYYVSSHLHVARWITPARGRNASMALRYKF